MLDAHLALVNAGESAAPFRIEAANGEVRCLQLSPLVGAASECLLGGRALLVVDTPPAPTSTRLRRRNRLSEKEARLACLLAAGTPLREVGRALGLSYNSARTYLDRVYVKTGAHRQADLVRLVLSL